MNRAHRTTRALRELLVTSSLYGPQDDPELQKMREGIDIQFQVVEIELRQLEKRGPNFSDYEREFAKLKKMRDEYFAYKIKTTPIADLSNESDLR